LLTQKQNKKERRRKREKKNNSTIPIAFLNAKNNNKVTNKTKAFINAITQRKKTKKKKRKKQYQQLTSTKTKTKTPNKKLTPPTNPKTYKTTTTSKIQPKTNLTTTKPNNKKQKTTHQNIRKQNIYHYLRTYTKLEWAWPTGLAQKQKKHNNSKLKNSLTINIQNQNPKTTTKYYRNTNKNPSLIKIPHSYYIPKPHKNNIPNTKPTTPAYKLKHHTKIYTPTYINPIIKQDKPTGLASYYIKNQKSIKVKEQEKEKKGKQQQIQRHEKLSYQSKIIKSNPKTLSKTNNINTNKSKKPK